MSYILSPIAVDLKQVAALIGSRSEPTLATLIEKFEGKFDRYDERAADSLDDNDEDDGEEDEDEDREPLTMATVLRQLVNSEAYDESLGFMYGYGLEFLCRHLGRSLPNGHWSSMRAEWAEKADAALDELGVAKEKLRVERHLMYRGSPFPLPSIDDFPTIGYLQREEIAAALAAFDADMADQVEDEGLREALAELRGWLQTCAERGCDLICFYA